MARGADLMELAEDSLQLLTAALHDERFPWLFHPDAYGAIIGMFELNNLGAMLSRWFCRHRTGCLATASCIRTSWS